MAKVTHNGKQIVNVFRDDDNLYFEYEDGSKMILEDICFTNYDTTSLEGISTI